GSARNSVDRSPPTTTVASGRCTSEPMPVALAAVIMPSVATTIISSMGRVRSSDPRIKLATARGTDIKSKQRAAQNNGGHAEVNYQSGHVDQRGHERRRRGRRVKAEPA